MLARLRLSRPPLHPPPRRVPQRLTGSVRSAQEMRKCSLVALPHWRSIQRADEEDYRLVLLDAGHEDELPQEAKDFLKEHSITLQPYDLHLDYNYWPAEDILEAILPEDLEEKPSGFASVGHVAHLNLNDEWIPWKHIIAQVFLDKNSPHIRTVVNKTDSIKKNIYRVFPMEILAGEPTTLVQQKEGDCQFTFDFAEVYWNARLHGEHARIVSQFKPEDVVADVFAGVGPFALPAAKKGCAVLANDLNPNGYKFLLVNIADNNLTDLVHPSCMDGRDFIRDVFNRVYNDPMPPTPPPKISRSQARKLAKQISRERRARKRRSGAHSSSPARSPSPASTGSRSPSPVEAAETHTHFVMNLPETAIEFLDAFRGVLGPENADGRGLSGIYDSQEKMPMIHCYGFTRAKEADLATAEIRQRVEAALAAKLVGAVESYWVRSVAPNKEMFCLSFQLPYEVAYAST
ncbi:Met-10+ like-protein-domain-containing protein, partial [Fomitopsis serialis]|uniref:Met-10+ like-protein-domain-containing protein n=1 Tax=Fomitopsis serialis TaxID=139415 RepID=UPI0020083738